MKNSILLLFAISILSACKSFNLSSIPEVSTLDHRIPPLQAEFDTRSFGPDYADLYNIPTAIISGASVKNTAINVVNNATETFTAAEDTKRIFQRALIDNVCESVGETRGYAVCRMGMRTKGIKSYINPTISVLTLGIANLFGYKYATYKDEIEVVIDIYNLNNEMIGSFTGLGVGEADARMYKGLHPKSARRMAHARAFTDAMVNMINKIKRESTNLTMELGS